MGNCTSAQPEVDYNTAPNRICHKAPQPPKHEKYIEKTGPPPSKFTYAPPKSVQDEYVEDYLNRAIKDAGKNISYSKDLEVKLQQIEEKLNKNGRLRKTTFVYHEDIVQKVRNVIANKSAPQHKQDIIEELKNKNFCYTKAVIIAAINSVQNEKDQHDIDALTEYIEALIKQREEEKKNDDFSNKLSSMIVVNDRTMGDIIWQMHMELGDGGNNNLETPMGPTPMGNNGLPPPNDDDNALSDADDAPVAFGAPAAQNTSYLNEPVVLN